MMRWIYCCAPFNYLLYHQKREIKTGLHSAPSSMCELSHVMLVEDESSLWGGQLLNSPPPWTLILSVDPSSTLLNQQSTMGIFCLIHFVQMLDGLIIIWYDFVFNFVFKQSSKEVCIVTSDIKNACLPTLHSQLCRVIVQFYNAWVCLFLTE